MTEHVVNDSKGGNDMENRSCVGYAFKSSIEDTVIEDDGSVHYCFAVYERLAAAQIMAEKGDEIVRVSVTIKEIVD